MGPAFPASMTSYLASPAPALVALCPRHPLRRRWPPSTLPAKMHRSASTTRASDEFFLNVSPPEVADQLPTYNPLSDASKKEASRRRASESAVHLIPLVLIVCGIVLWVFSHPVLVANEKETQVVSHIKGPKIDDLINQTCMSNCKTTKTLDRSKRIARNTVVRS